MNQPMDDLEAAPRHPADVDLVAFADGHLDAGHADLIAEHLAVCDMCTSALAQLDDKLDVSSFEPDFEFPPGFANLFQEPSGEPRPGELWRLEWADDTMLVLVTALEGDRFVIAPATFEGPPDAVATRVPDDDSPIDAPLFVWHELARQVPLGVFVAPAGELPSTYLTPEPTTVATFGEATAMLILELTMSAARLTEAWSLEAEAEAPAALPQLLLGHKPSEIKAATGIPAAAVTELRRGDRRATAEEAELLGAYLGADIAEIAGRVSIPRALARAVQRPVHRGHIRARAALQQVSEAVMRRLVAEQVMAQPARTVGVDRDVDAWDELVRHYLDE